MDDVAEEMKKEYVTEIYNLIKRCSDLSLLDLILKLLQKSI